MPEIRDVTGTAFVVAEYRARENAEANPIYRDPIVSLFLSKESHQAADRVAADFPPGVQGVIIRTRYFDDRLDQELRSGCRQVVIPGAGLDTRGVRKQKQGVTYFEIDAAEILDFKQERLAQAGIEARIVYIAGNYVSDGLSRLLADNGFNFDLPSYVIWEGNTMYLNRPKVLNVLTDLRTHVAKLAISFDYLTEAVIDYTTGDAGISGFTRHFADMGAPWTFGIDDLDALAGDAGLIVINNVKTAELYRTYWPNRPLGSKWYDNYALCTLAAP